MESRLSPPPLRKAKKNQLPTGDGIGYVEAKHHLLLSYCQDIVYYLLRKAKGLSADGHPVVRSLVEIRLFLEKIRPIDKKMEFQIQKLTDAAEGAAAQEKALDAEAKGKDQPRDEEDLLKFRPNPDLMHTQSAPEGRTTMVSTVLRNLCLLAWMMRISVANKLQGEIKHWHVWQHKIPISKRLSMLLLIDLKSGRKQWVMRVGNL